MIHHRRRKFNFRDFLDSNAFIALGVLFLILLSVSLGRSLFKDYKIKKDIQRLETEVTRLEGEQKQLVSLRDFFKTDFYIEQESRKSLGYAKPGEKVVIIEKELGQDTDDKQASELGNPRKWLKYFLQRGNNT